MIEYVLEKEKMFDTWFYKNLKKYGNTILLKEKLDHVSIYDVKRDVALNLGIKIQDVRIINPRQRQISKKIKEHYVVSVKGARHEING